MCALLLFTSDSGRDTVPDWQTIAIVGQKTDNGEQGNLYFSGNIIGVAVVCLDGGTVICCFRPLTLF